MKRIFAMLSAVLALVFCLTALPVSAAPVATASIGTVTAARGETVTVPVSITQISGIGAIALHIRYDGSVLECIDAQAVGIMNQLDMTTANTEPQNRPNEVWLTGMGLKGMNGSGELMQIQFKVKDNAPAGLSPLEFTATAEQELIQGTPIEALEMALTNGGVMVKDEQAAPTTEPPLQTGVVTTAPPATNVTNAPTQVVPAQTTGNQDAPTNGNEAPTNAPATEATTVPTGVVITKEDGTEVTDKQGQPVVKDAVGISMDKVVGKPGDTVTVNVSVSNVTGLTALGISVRFDPEALTFVSGERKGFLGEMSYADVTADGDLISIGATNPQPVSGDGVIATLTFTVTKKATTGVHTLKFDPVPMLMADTIDLPFEVFDGAVTVEGGATAGGGFSSTTLYVILGVVLAAIAAFVVALFARKKKAAKPKAAKPVAPKQPKPVLPTDISEEDGFDVDGE
ncbi:MAG: hypothetical protein IJC52_03305 [Clostridia bacterium]|nr:hypothetical protein [Clostridia bacterium]